jgi:hypothetical protein
VTSTPGPRVDWSSRYVEAALTPGSPVEQSVTFRVNRVLDDVTANAFAMGGTISVGALPTHLEPGQDYQLTFTMSLAEDHKQWPLRGTISIRNGRRSIGPLVVVRGTGPVQTAPTRTPTSTRTPTPIGEATPQPTATATPSVARVTWSPSSLRESLVPGQTTTVETTFQVNRAIASPQFRLYARDGAVSIDPSSLPSSLEPGHSYTLRLSLRMATRPHSANATLLIRDGHRSLGGPLTVKLSPLKPTPTATTS